MLYRVIRNAASARPGLFAVRYLEAGVWRSTGFIMIDEAAAQKVGGYYDAQPDVTKIEICEA